MCGTVLSPDLDHDWRTESEQILWRLSPALGLPFTVAWSAYAFAVPHRSFFSHFPIVGTLGRLLYVAALLWLAQVHLRAVGLDVDAFWFTENPRPVLAMCCGLAVADCLHWLMDGCPV